ncbi:MAG: HD domain-containing protein [Candidatus Bathyarchaeota archaeon]
MANLDAELRRTANKIKDKSLRDKVINLIQNPEMHIGGKIYEGSSLEISPASRNRHHSYEGGLIQHIISSSTIAITLCDIVERIYRGRVDRDIVLASVIIHDLMKPLTYKLREDGGYDTSLLGEQMDHLTLIVSKLIERGFPLEIVHAVTAHHGRNGPSSPRTVEALICFLADSTDATLNGEVLNAAKYLIDRYVGEQVRQLSAEESFSIVYAKQRRDDAGVKDAFKEMKLKRKAGDSTS